MISRIERRRFVAYAALGATSLALLRPVAARSAPTFRTVSPGALNEGVAWLWRTNANLLAKYGVADPDFLAPPAIKPRIGVDRDADGNIIGQWAHKSEGLFVAFLVI